MATLTLELDERTQAALRALAQGSAMTESELAADVLRRHTLVEELNAVRDRLRPHAEAAGFASDQDLLGELS